MIGIGYKTIWQAFVPAQQWIICVNQNLNILSKGKKQQKKTKDSPTDTYETPQKAGGSRRYLEKAIPILLGAGFLVLIAVLFGDRLIPAKSVELVSVVVKETAIEATTGNLTTPIQGNFEGEPIFQATGWIEASPYPYRASTLIDGFVDQVLVLEGEAVEKGQLLATMVADDIQLNVKTAESALQGARAEVESQKQAIAITRAEMVSLDAAIEAAESRLAELKDVADRLLILTDEVVSKQDIMQAVLRQQTQEAEVKRLASEHATLEARVQQQVHRQEALKAALKEVEVDLDRNLLAYERTRITSPISGIVQTLYAQPGQKRMAGADNPESTTIAVLFDPDALQARVDVPLEEAGKLSIGQAARVKSNFLPSLTFHGQVVRILGESDIQRNTLQAKIEILNPDPRLRPEMLCRAEFLSAQKELSGKQGASTDAYMIFVPENALLSINTNQATLFRLSGDRQHIEEVKIQILAELEDGHYPVIEGLRPGDIVVNNPGNELRHNQRIKAVEP